MPVGEDTDPPATQLSAAVRVGETLIVAGDEGGALEILAPRKHGWVQQERIFLHKLLSLPDGRDGEVDIEGLAVCGDWLWIVGSHALKRRKLKGKTGTAAVSDLSRIKRDANRFLLARIPLQRAESGHVQPVARYGDRRPAMMESGKRSSMLVSRLREDPMLAPYIDLPSKENGLDIEGIAVDEDRVWLGLRGPVLGGYAIVLQLDIRANKRDTLKARKVDGTRRFRKYFLPLQALGLRDLQIDGRDLLLLTGTTMSTEGPSRIVRWHDALQQNRSAVIGGDALTRLHQFEDTSLDDKAEAICAWEGNDLLVLYDSPLEARLSNENNTVLADHLTIS